nr:hypothetical protein [Tanacetum cinerariifolium]
MTILSFKTPNQQKEYEPKHGSNNTTTASHRKRTRGLGELGLELDPAVQEVQDNARPAEAEDVIDVEREGVCDRGPGVEGRIFREGLVVLSLEEVAGDGWVLEEVEPHEGIVQEDGWMVLQLLMSGELGLELILAVQGVQDNARPAEAKDVIDVEREGVCGRGPGVEGRVFREGLLVLSVKEVAGDGRVLERVDPREGIVQVDG